MFPILCAIWRESC